MYCPRLSSASISAASGSSQWKDDMCSECGRFCECADHFYTPPQSPAAQGFHLANYEVSNSPTSAPSQSFASFIGTPHYPHAPPSTPTTFHWPDETLQLWSSNVYKSTINFPPSELPEHLRDGHWCHMPDEAELAILFGPDAPIPFNWTPNSGQQSEDDANTFSGIPGFPKFIWGPLDPNLLVPRGNTSASQVVSVEIESTESRLNEATANNALDSGDDVEA